MSRRHRQTLEHRTRRGRRVGIVALCLAAFVLAGPVHAIENSAVGALNGIPLDTTNATVRLTRISAVASAATAEVSPNEAMTARSAEAFTLDVMADVASGQSGYDEVAVVLPAGYADVIVSDVTLAGATLGAACPATTAGQFCATAVDNRITLTLAAPVVDSSRLTLAFVATTADDSGAADVAVTVGRADALLPGVDADAGNANGDATDANSLSVLLIEPAFDPALSSLAVAPPLVVADGVAESVVTVTARDSADRPVAGLVFDLVSDRGATDTVTPVLGPTDANGVATGTIRSLTAGVATLTATGQADGLAIEERPAVTFTSGIVLHLTKTVDRETAVVGDYLSYSVVVRNLVDRPVADVTLVDTPAVGLKYVTGSARLDGVALPDPSGARPLQFSLGDVAALNDLDGSGIADPGEPGYRVLTYRMIVGAGATPGEHRNQATAVDVCASCTIANTAEATFTVDLDPVFDLGTIIGKVYYDGDADGWQDPGEPGIEGAMVALDDGTYALTDAHGRYHFPAVRPGQRLIKINLRSLPGLARATNRATRILSVTPGLMARASFGVGYVRDEERIGRDGMAGVAMLGVDKEPPIAIDGTTRSLTALVNGQAVGLAPADVALTHRQLPNVVTLGTEGLAEPVRFDIDAADAAGVVRWRLDIAVPGGDPLRSLSGDGTPPASVTWDARDGDGRLLGAGGVYHYQLVLLGADGREVRSERVLFGINREQAIELVLRGGAFRVGSHELTAEAVAMLRETARQIRALPDDRIVIEGHTDSVGDADDNERLSLNRARAALDYLVQVEGLPAERFQLFGYGESQPLEDNGSAAGRRTNRRVEIKGSLTETERASLEATLLPTPVVRIGGDSVIVGPSGRFHHEADARGLDSLELYVANERAQSLSVTVPLPTLEILQPLGEARLPFGSRTDQYRVASGADEADALVEYVIAGRTDPGNVLELDGEALAVGDDGLFRTTVALADGANVYGFAARNAAGFTRIVNLVVHVRAREAGGPVLVVEPIPPLAVMLPPAGVALPNDRLTVPGVTAPGNTVVINGEAVDVDASGRFFARLTVPRGESRIVAEVTDPQGYGGRIEHTVVHEPNDRFFLALADGKFSQLKHSGSIAGARGDSEFVTEGRLAYYFKGTVLGKYLVTSSFDTGQREFSDLFAGLDETDNRRLLANIDPDTIYPVYGDDSTVVYDAQSQGRFYLAVRSDQLDVLVGNYPVSLSDAELAAYQRTLYGISGSYRSTDTDAGGRAVTEATAFAASVDQAAVRDELRTTGGSLYFLSHRDVVEGSEQIALVVRDADTGLVLSRHRQERNRDYTIKYADGRVLFNRPLASFSEDNRLVGSDLLGGDPVYIEVDYETTGAGDDQNVAGVRLRRSFGDRLAVGVTRVDETLVAGDYQLTGVDAEVALAPGTRLVAEAATSEGSSALTFVSDDGGFTFDETAREAGASGNAWKIAVDADVGRLLGRENDLRLAGYVKQADAGFVSQGTGSDAGHRKYGLRLAYAINDRQDIQARYDSQTALDGPASSEQATVQWSLTLDGWEVSAELKDAATTTDAGVRESNTATAVRVRRSFAGRLSTTLEHQQTLRGVANDQTTLGVEYNAGERLALNLRATAGSRGRAAEAGARLKIWDSGLYLSRRLSGDGLGASSWMTVVGTETPMGEQGAVYSEYQWTDEASRSRRQSVLGIRRRWDRGDGLRLMMSAEHSLLDDAAVTTERNAFAAGLSYDRGGALSLSSRNEWRRERGGSALDQWLSVNNVTWRLGDDFSLLGDVRIGRTSGADPQERTADFERISLGVAYRPVHHDRFNALARYTRSGADLPGANGETLGHTDDVFAADWAFSLNPRWEWVGKQAWRLRRLRGDADGGRTSTWLSIQRLNLHLPRDLLLGAEYRWLTVREADDRRQGWLTEVAWEGVDFLRLGVGYNFTDFSDDEFAENDYTTQGWFLRLQGQY